MLSNGSWGDPSCLCPQVVCHRDNAWSFSLRPVAVCPLLVESHHVFLISCLTLSSGPAGNINKSAISQVKTK